MDEDNCSVLKLSSSREELPLLLQYSKEEREELFIKKLGQCSVILEDVSDVDWVKVKRAYLEDMIKYVSKDKDAVTPHIYPHIVNMFCENVFLKRTTPKFDSSQDNSREQLNKSWGILGLVYGLFNEFLDSDGFQPNIAGRFFRRDFIRSSLNIFLREDERERKALRIILIKIYGLMLNVRPYIMKEISDVLCWVSDERIDHPGISEILRLTAAILDSVTYIWLQEHKTFLLKVLLPLYKLDDWADFRRELNPCLDILTLKDPELCVPIIKGLIKYWPKADTTKEELFLVEIKQTLQFIRPNHFKTVMIPLFKKIAKCVSGVHSVVAVKAILVWSDPYVVSLILDNNESLMPIILPSLHQPSTWDKSVRDLIKEVRGNFMLKVFEKNVKGIFLYDK